MEKHYTKDELEMYRHGQMSLLGRMQCSSHLRECPDCRTLLDELESDDEFVKELRDSLFRLPTDKSVPEQIAA